VVGWHDEAAIGGAFDFGTERAFSADVLLRAWFTVRLQALAIDSSAPVFSLGVSAGLYAFME
jgi:hypothetical protein